MRIVDTIEPLSIHYCNRNIEHNPANSLSLSEINASYLWPTPLYHCIARLFITQSTTGFLSAELPASSGRNKDEKNRTLQIQKISLVLNQWRFLMEWGGLKFGLSRADPFVDPLGDVNGSSERILREISLHAQN